MLSERQLWPLLVVPAKVPSGDEPELVLCDWQGRQAVVAVVAPHKPDERSVRRCPSGVVINAAISAFELNDGVVRMRRSGGHKAEGQRADCKHKSLHYQPPLCCAFCLATQRSASTCMGLSTEAPRRTAHHGENSLQRDLLATRG